MKILHFCYDHPENPWCGGGGALRAWEICRILSRRHDVTCFCGGFPGAANQETPFKVRFAGNARGYIESRLKFMWTSRKLNLHPYDLIVDDFSYYAPVFSKFNAKPAVTILHGKHGLNALRYRGVLGFLSIISEYVLLPRRRSVIIVSEHLRSAIHPLSRVAVIDPGITLPENLPRSRAEYVLFLGRLDIWHKGIDTLIDAWARIPKDLQTLPLHIAGGGNAAPVKRLISRHNAANIRLIGRLTHSQALLAINGAAFVCMPSRMEGFGLVATEAMATGKPVIVSAVAPLTTIVKDGVSGLHVPVDNTKRLSQGIQRLLSDLELRSQLGNGAREQAKKYSWGKAAQSHERFYYETIASFRPGGIL